MKHKILRMVTLREDPSEQVIWNQERPIAYLNRADASIDEFVELENIIQTAPELLKALVLITNCNARGDFNTKGELRGYTLYIKKGRLRNNNRCNSQGE